MKQILDLFKTSIKKQEQTQENTPMLSKTKLMEITKNTLI